MNFIVSAEHRIRKEEVVLSNKVGEGGFGEVWKGTWRKKVVAVKKLFIFDPNPHTLQTLAQEITFAIRLRNHPRIIYTHGVVCSTNEIWIIMEFAAGGTLYNQLANHNKEISWNKRWRWALQAAECIAFLHEQGIVHRDIKSINFLLVDGGNLKISDFGMSAAASITSTCRSFTANCCEDVPIGSVRWLAPENTAREPIYNRKSDVFSLGMVLWEISSREIPFSDIWDDMQVIALVKYEEARPEIPSECPEELESIILKCWATNPNDRPTSGEVLTLIKDSLPNLEDKFSFQQAALVTSIKPPFAIHRTHPTAFGICYNSNDKCVYVNPATQGVLKINLLGDLSMVAKHPAVIGIALWQKENTLFVLTSEKGGGFCKLHLISLQQDTEMTLVDTNKPIPAPRDMIVNQKTGEVYISTAHDTILKISTDGEVYTILNTNEEIRANGFVFELNTYGIAFDESDDTLLVCDAQHDLLVKFYPDNGNISLICNLSTPHYIAVSPSGKTILVSSSSNKIFVVTKVPKEDHSQQYEIADTLGNGEQKTIDRRAKFCSFFKPISLSLDEENQLCYVLERSRAVRKISFRVKEEVDKIQEDLGVST